MDAVRIVEKEGRQDLKGQVERVIEMETIKRDLASAGDIAEITEESIYEIY